MFDTTLAARMDHTGAIDSGAAVLQLVDPDTGAPLEASGVMYGPEVMAFPDLWGMYSVPIDGLTASVRALAGATSRNGDERLRVAVRVELRNETDAPVRARVAVRLRPGGSDPLRRPLHSTPFAPGTSFSAEDGLVARDGTVVLAWSGPAPEVTLHDAPAGPDAPGATCTWSPTVAQHSAYFVDMILAGPPTGPARDEAELRAAMTALPNTDLFERSGWQSQKRGSVATLGTAFKDLDKTLCGSLHFLRSLGVANNEVRQLSDRPYGFPATDAAVPAEILATFVEFGLVAFAEDFLAEQIEAAAQAGAQLSPARRVALAHALTRCVRLGNNQAHAVALAAAIRVLVTEPAAVPPWADPDIVRQDLSQLLLRADPEQGGQQAAALPPLSWAAVKAGSVESEMQDMRRALSARDAPAAWDACLELLSGTNANGLGALQVGGDLDGGFAIGMLALIREAFIDDHGPDLHLVPAIGPELYYPQNPMRLPPLYTRYGVGNLKMYRHSNNRLAYVLTLIQRGEPELMFVYPPAGERVRKVGQATGGRGRLMPDGSVATVIDPLFAIGVNVVLRMEDGSADSDEDEALDAAALENAQDR
jgi:hypothetical protein